MSRVATLVLASLVVVGGLSACREERGAPPPAGGPDPSVERQLDDIESTLDGIESELNEG